MGGPLAGAAIKIVPPFQTKMRTIHKIALNDVLFMKKHVLHPCCKTTFCFSFTRTETMFLLLQSLANPKYQKPLAKQSLNIGWFAGFREVCRCGHIFIDGRVSGSFFGGGAVVHSGFPASHVAGCGLNPSTQGGGGLGYQPEFLPPGANAWWQYVYPVRHTQEQIVLQHDPLNVSSSFVHR